MSTTTKKDLIDRIAEETSQKRSAVKAMVQSFLDSVIRELSEGNRLEFRDFGVFEIRQRAPRMAQNPKTLERVPVPAKTTVKFKVGRLMKVALEREPAHPLAPFAVFPRHNAPSRTLRVRSRFFRTCAGTPVS